MLNFYRQNLVIGTDCIHHIHVLRATKHRMHAVQVRLGRMANEELAATRVATGMGHRQAPRHVLVRINFALDRVARATTTITIGTAALDHKIGDYAVEGQTIVKALFRQIHEVFHRVGSIIIEQLDMNRALGGFHNGARHAVAPCVVS